MAQTSAKRPNLGRVMVVGGCGFLGHHIVDQILEKYTTTALSVIDLRCTRYRRPDSDKVDYHEADITDSARVTLVFEQTKPEVVIHTASPQAEITGPHAHALFKKVNVDGTATIIEACKATGVKALVYTSSASVVSDGLSDLINVDERWPVIRGAQQSSYYTDTKAEAESLVIAANSTGPTPLLTTSIRPAGIIGEGDPQTISSLLQVYLNGKDAYQLGDNNNLFDFTYVYNVAHAHLLAARALLATYTRLSSEKAIPVLEHERIDGESFFITNDSPVYWWDFMRAIFNYAGSPHGTSHVWVIPRDVGIFAGTMSEWVGWLTRRTPNLTAFRAKFTMMTRYYDISKAKRRLGYEPIVSLEEGLRRSVEWTVEENEKKAKA